MIKVIAETVERNGEKKVKTNVKVEGYADVLANEASAAVDAIFTSIMSEGEDVTDMFKEALALRLLNSVTERKWEDK